jgi:septal ring factor EnvC (AmiA/AmiB activator)
MFFPMTAAQQFRFFFFKHYTILLVCFLILPLVIPQNCPAETDRKAEKQRIEQGIQKFRINIKKMQNGIAGQKMQIESSKEKEHSLLDELAQIDTNLFAQLEKMHKLKEQMDKQEILITVKEDELQESQSAKQIAQNHLQKRIKAYYKMGEIGVANVFFSTESLPRMLKFRDSFASLIDYDKSLINVYRKSIAGLQQAKDTLSLEKGVLDDFITLAQKEQDTINTIKHEKETLLSQVETQQELHKHAVREMKKVADHLADALDSLKRKDTLFDQGFSLNKGKHPAPLHGNVIALFGQEHKNRLGINGKTTGITIATEGTNQVHAIFEGEVRYASYLYGYGNTIIVDHGHQYFSITSRLEKLLVKEGDNVEQGDIIALTGDTATLMEKGIFLAIRHGSTPLDPLQWLDNNGLILP